MEKGYPTAPDTKLGSPDAGTLRLRDNREFWGWFRGRFPSNIWSQFPLEDTLLNGLFIFSKLCRDSGVPLNELPDHDMSQATRNPSGILSSDCMPSLDATTLVDHCGPSSDGGVEYCTCLLCRWRSVIKVLISPSHLWSPQRLSPGVKRLVEEGLPSVVREHVWFYLSGGLHLLRTRRPKYLSHFPRALDSSFSDLIDLDIQRTFADDPEWRLKGYDQVTRRVLLAYADRNKSVGYCQGLSFIVGILVTVVNEEIAFIILCAIIEDNLLPPDYYTSLTGAVVDKAVLEALVAKFLTSLKTDPSSPDISFMSIPWNMCLFSANLTRAISIRVWDFLFAFGPCVLFRISLGILGELADELSRNPNADPRSIVKKIEANLKSSDILCFMQRFDECDNVMINSLREQVRNSTVSSQPPGNGGGFMTVRDSDPSVSENFLPPPSPPPRPARSETSRIQHELSKRTIDGLGDFMGQPRRSRNYHPHHSH